VQICVIRGLVFICGLLCVFVATHFAAGKYIFDHQKSLEEAYFPAKSISFHTNSFSALVFFTF